MTKAWPVERSVSTLPITWTFNNESGLGPRYLTLGLRVSFAVAGYIVGCQYLQNTADTQPHGMSLYGPDFSLIQGAWFLPSTVAGGESPWAWKARRLRLAWRVEADTLYIFAVSFIGPIYASSSGYLTAADVTVGNVTIKQNDFTDSLGNGLFLYGVFNELPNDSAHNGTIYGIEPLFKPFDK